MFEDLKQAFREAVVNFRREIRRDDVPEAVDDLLRGMREEAVGARTRLRHVEDDLAATRAAAERERREADTCRRREALATRIGDEETARVAGEYADKHTRRVQVLEGKAQALESERALGEAEIEQMLAALKDARDRRTSLAAAAGRSGARASILDADDLFSALDRMAERVEDDGRRGEAEEVVAAGEAGGEGPQAPPDLDARLDELKRRAGRG